jgi:hypothetical protein
MCILGVFCDFLVTMLQRKSHYVIFPKVETAITLKLLVASAYFFPQIVDLFGAFRAYLLYCYWEPI